MSTESASKKRPFRLRFHSWIRWVHTYLSMFTFLVVLFFSATGVFLNHPEWTLGVQPKTVEAKGTLEDKAWVTGDVNWLRVAESVRAKHGLHGVAGDNQADDEEASLRFSAPAYAADVVIERATGAYTIKAEGQGALEMLNDLHRGKNSGRAWSWALDLSAYFLILISLTGVGMVFFLKKVKLKAILTVVAGVVVTILLMRLANG